jgi:hypothetical protein
MAPTITIHASQNQWKAQGTERATRAEAEADLDFFPKGAKFTVVHSTGRVVGTEWVRGDRFWIEADGWLKPNKATGAKNETAIKRYRTVVRNAECMAIAWDTTSYGAVFASRDEFEAWLAA